MKTYQCTGHSRPARHHIGLASKHDESRSIDDEAKAWRRHTVSSNGVCVRTIAWKPVNHEFLIEHRVETKITGHQHNQVATALDS
jgi:hypothetical protein